MWRNSFMAWSNETYLIGEKVKVENERDYGVVTRIDTHREINLCDIQTST